MSEHFFDRLYRPSLSFIHWLPPWYGTSATLYHLEHPRQGHVLPTDAVYPRYPSWQAHSI